MKFFDVKWRFYNCTLVHCCNVGAQSDAEAFAIIQDNFPRAIQRKILRVSVTENEG